MLLIAVFMAAVAIIFAIHVTVLRKALNEHQELMAMSSWSFANETADAKNS